TRGKLLRLFSCLTCAGSTFLAGCHSGSSLPRLATCGQLPESNGGDAGKVDARLDLPQTVATGTTLHGHIMVSASHHVLIVSGQPFEVLILRDGRVVGGGFYGLAVAG